MATKPSSHATRKFLRRSRPATDVSFTRTGSQKTAPAVPHLTSGALVKLW